MHWVSKLSGTRADELGPRLLGPDADRLRAAVGPAAVMWAVELGETIVRETGKELGPLLGYSAEVVNALDSGTTSTTLRILTILSGLAEPGASVVTTEATEATRDMARRGLTLSEYTRTIRFGHSVLAAAFFDAVTAGRSSDEHLPELRRVSLLLFKLIDEFIAKMSEVFRDEQSAWGASESAAKLELVRKIIDGDPTDLREAERMLSYPLRGSHLAVVALGLSPGEGTAYRLRSAVDPILRCWGTPRSSLLIPVGSNTLWAWGAFPVNHRLTPRRALPEFEGMNVVVGQVGCGVEGFQRTHLEARAVERLVRQGGGQPSRPLTHRDVDLDALLLADPETAREFVARYLGPLAVDDPRMKELRVTLRRYLDLDRSLTKVAALENISRNTVTYRVQQAFDLCGYAPDTPTVKVRAALAMVEWMRNPQRGK